MSDENKYNMSDMINFVKDTQPLEFEMAFAQQMLNRVTGLVADRKIELAKDIFNAPAEVEAETDNEDEGE